MKKPFFIVGKSHLDFDETVAAISKAAPEHGWTILSACDLHRAGLEAGNQDVAKVNAITIYDPHNGHTLLHDDDSKRLSALMPQTVSVYESADGQVYVAGINLGRFSKMFRGKARDVLKASANKRTQTLQHIVEPEESQDPRRMVVVIASILAAVALVSAVVVFISRIRSSKAAEESASNTILKRHEKAT